MGNVLTDPPIHGVNRAGAPWVLHKGSVKLSRNGRFDLRVKGLVLASNGTTGTVTMIAAHFFCAPDSTVAAFTAGPVPLASDGDARIRQKRDGAEPVPRTRRARANPGSGRAGLLHRSERLHELGRKADELVLDQDELVAPQGFDRFEVDLGEWARAFGNEPQGLRPPLPERALERALLPQRLEPPSS